LKFEACSRREFAGTSSADSRSSGPVKIFVSGEQGTSIAG
jgi:hypothetical protein